MTDILLLCILMAIVFSKGTDAAISANEKRKQRKRRFQNKKVWDIAKATGKKILINEKGELDIER